MNKKVLCGLDIGTNSVGWCLTDENNKIIKKNGKSLWGVRMFEEAKGASERRNYRSNRRRLDRRKERVDLLRSLFQDEINKVDTSFFYRLDYSFYQNEDRPDSFKYTLFNDKNYTDTDYYKENPTIYHLRQRLIYSNQKEDIRKIYLALHHMVKYRGNFLNDSKEFKPMNEADFKAYYEELRIKLSQFSDEESINLVPFDNKLFKELVKINNDSTGIKDRSKRLNELLNKENNKVLKEVIISLICGSEINVKKLHLKNIEDLEFKNICVKSEKYEENIKNLLVLNPDQEDYIECLILCQKIYQYFLLGKLLGNFDYLSDAMVNIYETHHEQLKELKKYIKKYHSDDYGKIFRESKDEKINNYAAYIGSNNSNNAKVKTKHVNQDEFYTFLKGIIGKDNSEFSKSIINLMSENKYLKRLNSSENGVFPYQLNLLEMKKILENQAQFYPFLLNKDEDGLTTIDKIISILVYKIPYYVGPLMNYRENDKRSSFSWVKRTEEKIYPWNFNKVVDLDESASRFIRRMQNKCSYLMSQYCMPANSIIFSYFNVLNHLNKTFINGMNIPYEEKISIIKDLFLKKRKVTKKQFKEYLKAKYGEEVEIATTNNKELQEFDFNMASYYDFAKIFGEEDVKNNIDLIEQIILDITIFEDKSILAERLKKYDLSDEIIKKIKGLTYAKYCSISNELITNLYYIDDNGVGKNILNILEETTQNFQEILFSEKYDFQNKIREYNLKNSPELTKCSIEEYVENISYLSPGMKRPLIQAYKICEELEKIVGQPIDEYYVECTRTNKAKKKAPSSRYEKIKQLYEEAERLALEDEQFHKLKQDLQNFDENKFQSDKYYLYFMQMGRCMYSGEIINIEELFDSDKYDIDHIIPQSMIKDDSLDNRVLVKQEKNRIKSDTYPISQSILFNGNYIQAYRFYKFLKDINFISEEKYKRLTAREISESQLESFVNRQLVYTNQAVKCFVNAINYLKDNNRPKIVFSKAENVSDFRREFELVKCREANNFHHAHDAYLNIVVGRAIDTYFKPFSQNMYTLKWMHEKGLTTNPQRIFIQNKDHTKKPIRDGEFVVWDYDNSIMEVKKNIYNRFDILTSTRTYVKNNLLEQVSILSKGKSDIPLKSKSVLSDCSKYGGYRQLSYGFYCLIKDNNKNKYVLEAIPNMYKNNINEYLEKRGYTNFDICLNKLNVNSVIEQDNRKFCITGVTGNRYVLINQIERIFSERLLKIIYKIEKFNKKFIGEIESLAKNKLYKDMNGKEKYQQIQDDMKFKFNKDNNLIIAPASSDKNKEISISNEELIQLFDCFLELFSKEIYGYSVVKTLSQHLIENKALFNELSIIGKIKILSELLQLLKCNEREQIDLSLINLKDCGILLMNKNLKSCRIIHESITGFYRKVIFEIK